MSLIYLDSAWAEHLESEYKKDYMIRLLAFLKNEKKKGKEIFPNNENIFASLKATSMSNVKVVIIGQDPYHAEGQAHGLSFSVPDGVRIPPSLRNIYKELQSDLGITPAQSGDLSDWAQQGVLLLNNVLTVQAGLAASHRNKGWERLTNSIIGLINYKLENVVFLLWGSDAQRKVQFIDHAKHLVLNAPHPSPLSAYRGFLGCRHFSQANDYLAVQGREGINWDLNA